MWQRIKFYKIMILMVVCLLGTVESFAESKYRLTHGDAAQILCRYSGLLDRHVADDASLGTCVQLLNDIGITFELMAIIDQQPFKQSDCARVMGQLEILFSGEAGLSKNEIVLPSGYSSWEEYCVMNDVDYKKAHSGMQVLGQSLWGG